MKTRRRLTAKMDARELRLLRDRVAPSSIGTHIGGGRHVDMPDTWDGIGQVPPGWSGYMGEVEEFDTGDDSTGFRVDFPRDLLSRIDRAPEKFTAEERQLLEGEFALCDDDPKDGDPSPPRPKDPTRQK